MYRFNLRTVFRFENNGFQRSIRISALNTVQHHKYQ